MAQAAVFRLPTAAAHPIPNPIRRRGAVIPMSLEQAKRIVALDLARQNAERRAEQLAKAHCLEVEAETLLRRAATIREWADALVAS